MRRYLYARPPHPCAPTVRPFYLVQEPGRDENAASEGLLFVLRIEPNTGPCHDLYANYDDSGFLMPLRDHEATPYR